MTLDLYLNFRFASDRFYLIFFFTFFYNSLNSIARRGSSGTLAIYIHKVCKYYYIPRTTSAAFYHGISDSRKFRSPGRSCRIRERTSRSKYLSSERCAFLLFLLSFILFFSPPMHCFKKKKKRTNREEQNESNFLSFFFFFISNTYWQLSARNSFKSKYYMSISNWRYSSCFVLLININNTRDSSPITWIFLFLIICT